LELRIWEYAVRSIASPISCTMASRRCVRTETVTGSLMASRVSSPAARRRAGLSRDQGLSGDQERWCRARSAGRRRWRRSGAGRPRRGGQRDQNLELLQVERLGDVGENAGLERARRALVVLVAGQHQHWRLKAAPADLGEELEARHLRHVQVEQDQVE